MHILKIESRDGDECGFFCLLLLYNQSITRL